MDDIINIPPKPLAPLDVIIESADGNVGNMHLIEKVLFRNNITRKSKCRTGTEFDNLKVGNEYLRVNI